MNNYEEQICKAIDIILKKRFADLKFNKTIFATIIKAKEDGIYELKYQDTVIEAYSLTGLKYKENDNVYVLIQNNDINDKKYIISYAGEIPMPVLDEYLTKHNPTGTGYFSMNQKDGKVPGDYSTALGHNCDAQGYACMAEGIETFTYGNGNHAEGYKTSSVGSGEDGSSHAEGAYTLANGKNSHAEGYRTIVNEDYSHAEGFVTTASGFYSHSEGEGSLASGVASHAEGYTTKATGDRSHAEGYDTIASGFMSHAEGDQTTASGNYGSHAEGENSLASGTASHTEGYWTTASGDHGSHAEGEFSLASGTASHAEGYTTIAIGKWSHAEGCRTTATNLTSHAEGDGTLANGEHAHAEGFYTTANEYTSHSEGNYTMALESGSHAEGFYTTAKGRSSHTEGNATLALGNISHAEGEHTTASGDFSHTEGWGTLAGGNNSHAEGTGTIANGNSQHVQGKYNIEDTEDKYAHIVGGGEWNDALRDCIRKNIHTVDWDGNAWYAGDVISTDSDGNQHHLNDLRSSVLLTNQNLDDIFATELTNYYANYENLVVGKPEGVYNFSLIASGADEQGQYFQQLYANDNIYYRISKEKNPCPVDLHYTFVYDTIRDHPEYVPSSSTSAFKIVGKYNGTNRPLIENEFFVKTTELEHKPFCLYFKDSNKICYYLAKKDTSSGYIYGSYSCYQEGGNKGSYGDTYFNGVTYTTIDYTLGNPIVTFYNSEAYESTKIPLYYSDDTENILNYLNTGNKSNALNFRKIEYDWTEWKSITGNTSTTSSAIEISYDNTSSQLESINVQAAIDELSQRPVITIDNNFSKESENPLQNKVITEKIEEIENSMPKPIIVDNAIDENSTNPVQNKVIAEALKNIPSGGTTNYTNLENKPSINGVTLEGNKTLKELGIDIPTAAKDISYNNSKSGLEATDVQNAIDYLVDNIGEEADLFISNQSPKTVENVKIESSSSAEIQLLNKTVIANSSGYVTHSATLLDNLSNYETVDIKVYYNEDYIITNYNVIDILNKTISVPGPSNNMRITFSDTEVSNIDCYYNMSLEIIGYTNNSSTIQVNINTDWLKDKNKNFFSPNVLMDSIQDNNGTSLKEYIEQHSGSGRDILASQHETFFDNIIVINNITPFVMPAMTSDIYTNAEGFIFKTSASSVFSNLDVPNGKAYRPFDGTEARGAGDCWHPTSGSPQWLLLELPYLVSIKKFTIKNRESYVESPNYVIFQGSNDGETFEDIVDFYFPSGSNQSLTIEIENNNYYKYYRWYESSVHNYGVISKIIIDKAYMMEE